MMLSRCLGTCCATKASMCLSRGGCSRAKRCLRARPAGVELSAGAGLHCEAETSPSCAGGAAPLRRRWLLGCSVLIVAVVLLRCFSSTTGPAPIPRSIRRPEALQVIRERVKQREIQVQTGAGGGSGHIVMTQQQSCAEESKVMALHGPTLHRWRV